MTLLLRRAQELGIRDIVRNAQAQERTDTENAGTLTHEGVGTPEAHYHTDKPAHWKKKGQTPKPNDRQETCHRSTGTLGHRRARTRGVSNARDRECKSPRHM